MSARRIASVALLFGIGAVATLLFVRCVVALMRGGGAEYARFALVEIELLALVILLCAFLALRRLRTVELQRDDVRRENEFRASLLAQVNNAVVAIDLEQNVTYWNRCAELLYGWRADEVLGRPTAAMDILSVDPEASRAIASSLEQAGVWAGEIDTRRRDASVVPVFCAIAALRDGSGRTTGHVAVLNDVSWRRVAESELRRSEAKYRDLVETSHDLIWSVDSEGRLSFVNRAAAQRILGFAPEQIEGRRFAELLPLESISGDVDAFRRARAGEPRFHFEIAYRHQDGRILHLDVAGVTVRDEEGRLVRSSGTAADVTERRLKETERRRYTRQLQELAGTAILVTSELSSEAVLRVIAGRARDIIGARRAFATASLDDFDDALFASAPPGAATPAEMRARFAGGSSFATRGDQASTLMVAMTRRDGSVMGAIVVEEKLEGSFTASDQSILAQLASLASVAIVNAELFDEIQRASARLEERVAERTAALREINASLETFAATVSHDLRAPLNAMKGFAGVLVDDFADQLGPQGRSHLERIVASAERMEALISDLLEFCRLGGDELPLEPADVREVVRAAMLQVESVIRRHGARVAVSGPAALVRTHAPSLTQCVANLVANAVKFVPPGRAPRVQLRIEAGDAVARVEVRDNGIGIADADRERIFDPFERLHAGDVYPGTGLGLAIVRRAMAKMEGRVGVESALGAGSTFWLEVPLDPARPKPARRPPREARPGRDKRTVTPRVALG